MGLFDSIIAETATKNTSVCGKCKLLKQPFIKSVIKSDADIVIIKEAPNKKEAESGKQLSGTGTSFLLQQLKKLNKTYSILYAIHCYLGENKISEPILKRCSKLFLEKDLQKISKAELILTMGEIATKQTIKLLSGNKKQKPLKFNKLVGNFLWIEGKTLFILPSPHTVNQNPSMKRIFIETIDKVVAFLEGSLFKGKNYKVIKTIDELNEVKDEILKHDTLAIDIETSAFSTKRVTKPLDIKCFSIVTEKNIGYGFYFMVNGVSMAYKKEVWKFLVSILKNKKIAKVFHNAKFEYKQFLMRGVRTVNFHDTLILAHLLNENEPKNLKALATKYTDGYEGLVIDFENTPLPVLVQYNIEDSDVTLQIFNLLYPQVKNNEGLHFIYKKVMLKAIHPLVLMELNGVKLNVDYLHKLERELKQKIRSIENKIFKEHSLLESVNLDSTLQLREYMFGNLKLKPKGKTKKGADSLTKNDLKEFAAEGVSLAKDLLDRRYYVKQLTTYVHGLPESIGDDGRINSTYSITTTVTGRLASSHPNLQNIPRDKKIKRMFIADDDCFFVSGDFSQAELRIAASVANEKAMIKIYKEGGDIHRLTASVVLQVPFDQVTKEQRQSAKAINFGFIYKMSAEGFQEYAKYSYGVTFSLQEAKKAKNNYFASYPAIGKWHEESESFVKRNGFIVSPLGRIRHLPDVFSEDKSLKNKAIRQAINSPIQGAASDFTVMTIIKLQQFIEKFNLKTKLALTVHDSIVFITNKKEAKMIIPFLNEVVDAFQDQFDFLKCPMKMDFEVGKTYGDLKELESIEQIDELMKEE